MPKEAPRSDSECEKAYSRNMYEQWNFHTSRHGHMSLRTSPFAPTKRLYLLFCTMTLRRSKATPPRRKVTTSLAIKHHVA